MAFSDFMILRQNDFGRYTLKLEDVRNVIKAKYPCHVHLMECTRRLSSVYVVEINIRNKKKFPRTHGINSNQHHSEEPACTIGLVPMARGQALDTSSLNAVTTGILYSPGSRLAMWLRLQLGVQ
jgi:hypothetical protein